MTLSAETLTLLANAASARAADEEGARGVTDAGRRQANRLRVAAQDARRAAQSANGMGTHAGLMWSICVQNDRETAQAIAELVERHAGSETARADLADALRGWTENAAGTENVSCKPDGIIYGKPGGAWDLSPLMLTLIRSAIGAIDWHTLASNMLDERALQTTTEES